MLPMVPMVLSVFPIGRWVRCTKADALWFLTSGVRE